MSYSTSAVPHFNGEAVHVFLGFGSGLVIILATDDDRGALNVSILVDLINAIVGHVSSASIYGHFFAKRIKNSFSARLPANSAAICDCICFR
jgi:hypothetical protein